MSGPRKRPKAISAASARPSGRLVSGTRSGGWRLRNWPLRTRLGLLLVIPLLLAGSLGGLRIAGSLADAEELTAVQRQVALREAVATVIDGLQTERHRAAAAAATQAGDEQALVDAQTQQVDLDVTALRDLESSPEGLQPSVGAAYADVLIDLSTLADLRARVAQPDTDVELVIGRYSEVISTLLRFNRAAVTGTAAGSASLAAGIGYLAEAREQLSVQHAVLLSASLENLITSVQAAQLRTTDAAFDSAIRNFSEAVPSGQRQVYFTTVRGNATTDRDRLLLIGLGEWPTFVALDSIASEWDATASELAGQLFTVETALSDDLLAQTSAASDSAVTDAVRDSVIVALLLFLALILLVLVARSVLRPLRALRLGALDVAQRRLPEVVEALRRPGGWTEEDLRPVPIPVHTREDIGQVARAFDEVHREAVRLASEQAMMRGNVNDMFVNLSRRSQSLVERQLSTIDSLERGERDPEALGELFRLDHLATRMRRNNENLLVLAGAETRLRTGPPRPVLDILRAAISEIEEYPRVSIESVPDHAVRGTAVNDLVHLIAELLDNATTFSPEQAKVVLASAVHDDGDLSVEIRDTGPGMSATQANEINQRLADPPVVDVSVSRQMGLFVVGRLAQRHGIAVRVRVTQIGRGLTVVVSVPGRLISPAGADLDAPAQAAPSAPPDLAQTPAGSAATPPAGSVFAARLPVGRTNSEDPSRQIRTPTGPVPTGSVPTGPNEAFVGRPDPSSVDIFAAALTGDAPPADPEGDSEAQSEAQTPIYQEMRSAWFRQYRRDPVGWGTVGAPDAASTDAVATDAVATDAVATDAVPPVLAGLRQGLTTVPEASAEFGSAADEGWLAAQQLRVPVDAGTTRAGLPRRVPLARLVPGATARSAPESAASPGGRLDRSGRVRDADRVRGNLSSYQRGSLRGRHSSPVDDLEGPAGPDDRTGSHAALLSNGDRPASGDRP